MKPATVVGKRGYKMDVIVWQASQKKRRQVKKSDLVKGFQTTYKVENQVQIELHFANCSIERVYSKASWVITESPDFENVFHLTPALNTETVTVNGFARKGDRVVPVYHAPAKKVSSTWKGYRALHA
jgi:hypothetical protein